MKQIKAVFHIPHLGQLSVNKSAAAANSVSILASYECLGQTSPEYSHTVQYAI